MSQNKETDPIFYVQDKKVGCDGGGGVLGHPMTYYTIPESGSVRCKYCDRLYVYEEG